MAEKVGTHTLGIPEHSAFLCFPLHYTQQCPQACPIAAATLSVGGPCMYVGGAVAPGCTHAAPTE